MIVPEDARADAVREGVVAAADVDGGDLAVVADIDDLAVDRVDRALEGQPAAGGTHNRLVQNHDHPVRQPSAVVLESDEEPIDGSGVRDAGGHGELVSGRRGWRNADDWYARSVKGGAVDAEGGGLAGPGLADHHLNARARGGERADHGHVVFVEGGMSGEDLADDPVGESRDTRAAAGGAPEEFSLCGQQVGARLEGRHRRRTRSEGHILWLGYRGRPAPRRLLAPVCCSRSRLRA
jgi:hypothetical protein